MGIIHLSIWAFAALILNHWYFLFTKNAASRIEISSASLQQQGLTPQGNSSSLDVLERSQKDSPIKCHNCQVNTHRQNESERAKFAQTRYPQVAFSPRSPIGINTISKLLGETANTLGCGDAKGHGFWRIFMTSLVKDAGVSTEESIGSASHSSVSAHRTYTMRNHASEMAKLPASGLV